ncbi:MAG: anthranilate synthase component I family protein [Cytophagales bacterium]
MRSSSYRTDIQLFKNKALQFAVANYSYLCALEGNELSYLHQSFPQILAFGAQRLLKTEKSKNGFESLAKFQKDAKNAIFGFLTYDLKNELENLKSELPDPINLPALLFFEPSYTIEYLADTLRITGENPDEIFSQISAIALTAHNYAIELSAKISKKQYVEKIKTIQSHIKRGNIYEMNFCQEYYAENAAIEPSDLFAKLNEISPMPFATFFKMENKYLICASPERFLKKEGTKLISQPIKGTVRRGSSFDEDKQLINSLLDSEKELAENIMIVDLVRNDLSKTAKDGTVHVEELCGIYSFSNVHQMISTVVSTLGDQYSGIEALKNAFPMGSMTGAPKIKAMELIEEIEETKRGLFSGSVGYINSDKNFDFNVVIRSVLYNSITKYLSCQVGSAITIDAIPEKEWEECEVKISAIKKALNYS